MTQDICDHGLLFEIADRLRNGGCCFIYKMIDDFVHQDHLSILSASEIFQAKMLKHAPYTAYSSVITCYKSCCSKLHSFNLIDI